MKSTKNLWMGCRNNETPASALLITKEHKDERAYNSMGKLMVRVPN